MVIFPQVRQEKLIFQFVKRDEQAKITFILDLLSGMALRERSLGGGSERTLINENFHYPSGKI